MSDVEVYFNDDMQLMGYGESDSSGAWLKFQVEPDDLEHFRGLKGKVFNVTLVKMLDDGTPAPAPTKKRFHMAEWFGQMERDNGFRKFLLDQGYSINSPDGLLSWAELIRVILGVDSRAELDKDDEARARGREIMNRYQEWSDGNNR